MVCIRRKKHRNVFYAVININNRICRYHVNMNEQRRRLLIRQHWLLAHVFVGALASYRSVACEMMNFLIPLNDRLTLRPMKKPRSKQAVSHERRHVIQERTICFVKVMPRESQYLQNAAYTHSMYFSFRLCFVLSCTAYVGNDTWQCVCVAAAERIAQLQHADGCCRWTHSQLLGAAQ